MARRRRRGKVDSWLSSALRDLAEFGWVHVQGADVAHRIYRAARDAGQAVRIDGMPRGWFRVVLVDMKPRQERG